MEKSQAEGTRKRSVTTHVALVQRREPDSYRAGGRFSILIGSAGCQRALARQLGGSGGMPPQKNFDFETF